MSSFDKYKKLKPSEIKAKIKFFESCNELAGYSLKSWNEQSSREFLLKELAKQQAIINEAVQNIEKAYDRLFASPTEIENLHRRLRYNDKHLKLLENAAAIQKLQELQDKLAQVEGDDQCESQ